MEACAVRFCWGLIVLFTFGTGWVVMFCLAGENADGRRDVVDSLESAFGHIDDEGIFRGLRVVDYALYGWFL